MCTFGVSVYFAHYYDTTALQMHTSEDAWIETQAKTLYISQCIAERCTSFLFRQIFIDMYSESRKSRKNTRHWLKCARFWACRLRIETQPSFKQLRNFYWWVSQHSRFLYTSSSSLTECSTCRRALPADWLSLLSTPQPWPIREGGCCVTAGVLHVYG